MNKPAIFLALTALLLTAVPSASFAQNTAAPATQQQTQTQMKRVAELNLDFTLVNATGYSIAELEIAPTSQDNWGPNIIEEVLADGESLDISFHPKANAAKWDIRITWEDGGDMVYWRGLNLTEISKLTLHYDEDSGKTSASVE